MSRKRLAELGLDQPTPEPQYGITFTAWLALYSSRKKAIRQNQLKRWRRKNIKHVRLKDIEAKIRSGRIKKSPTLDAHLETKSRTKSRLVLRSSKPPST